MSIPDLLKEYIGNSANYLKYHVRDVKVTVINGVLNNIDSHKVIFNDVLNM
jgi:hypothetical protein